MNEKNVGTYNSNKKNLETNQKINHRITIFNVTSIKSRLFYVDINNKIVLFYDDIYF